MIDIKDIKVNGVQLTKILELHKAGQGAKLRDADLRGADLEGADLRDADLQGADLRGADLRGADLEGAKLQGAKLQDADLQGAKLQGAKLRDAYLRGADLEGAYLQGADLRDAKLQGAKLQGADLRDAKLQGADLRDAKLQGAKGLVFIEATTSILPEGDIIGWKKCNEGVVKLLIPAKAARSNSTGRKCRAEYVKDLAHFTFDGKETREPFTSIHNPDFVYKVGKTIKPNDFDKNRWEECSSGIHFFITRFEAECY